MAKVSITFKRKRAAVTAAADDSARQFAGCFNVADEDEGRGDDDAIRAEEERRLRGKRLALEDVAAKAARLQREGCTLAEAGRFRAAMARWAEAAELAPQSAVLCELRAQASLALGEDFRAIQFALRATQLAPEWGDGFLTLARSHVNFGELELALAHLDTALALLGASDELLAERREVQELLARQREVIAAREAQEAHERDADKLQVLSCMKHLSLRGQTTLE